MVAPGKLPGAEPDRQRPADRESARLDRRDQVDRRVDGRRHRLDRGGQASRVKQQRRDVAKLDSGLGEIRDRADQRLQFIGASDH